MSKEELIDSYENLLIQSQETKKPEDRSQLLESAYRAVIRINDIEIRELAESKRTGSMQYSANTIERLAIIVAIREHCLFITDIAAFLPVSRETMYAQKINKSDKLRDIILANKVKTKHALRAKWYKSDAPALQIALYRLLSDQDELNRLTQQKLTIDNGLFDGDSKDKLDQDFYLPDGYQDAEIIEDQDSEDEPIRVLQESNPIKDDDDWLK